jgi:hypothetical protein
VPQRSFEVKSRSRQCEKNNFDIILLDETLCNVIFFLIFLNFKFIFISDEDTCFSDNLPFQLILSIISSDRQSLISRGEVNKRRIN